MTMGDRVAVLRAISGKEISNLQQIDSPRKLYDEPDNLFVAGFIGSPSMNFVYANIEGEGEDVFIRWAEYRLKVDPVHLAAHKGLANYKGKEIVIGMRPESFEILPAVSSDVDTTDRVIDVKVDLLENLGAVAYAHFEKDTPPVVTPELRELMEDEGTDVDALPSITKFTAQVDPDFAVRSGEMAKLFVDTGRLHFFDKANGKAIRN
jgi:multiple sugar transport system ATP-binding protein